MRNQRLRSGLRSVPLISFHSRISHQGHAKQQRILRRILQFDIEPSRELHTQCKKAHTDCLVPVYFASQVARLTRLNWYDEYASLPSSREHRNTSSQCRLDIFRQEFTVRNQVCNGLRRDHRRTPRTFCVLPTIHRLDVGGRYKHGRTKVDFLNIEIIHHHLRQQSHLRPARIARKPNGKRAHKQSDNDRSACCYGRPGRPINRAGFAQPPALSNPIQHAHSLIRLRTGRHSATPSPRTEAAHG